jgi:ATPase subunit of ABC transporter with duplicated ATPase domains
MITIQNVAKRYGAQLLFEQVNLRFDPGKRYGIVGANGAGKSTLLRMITGEESLDEGDISVPARVRLGTLNQDHYAFEQETILDVVLQGKPALAEALREKTQLLSDQGPACARIALLEETIADHDGYAAESDIGKMLEGLGIPVEKHRQPMQVLSGGYKLRVLLAQCLFGDPDVLLLDEPTNHLDIFSIRWLEEYLTGLRGAVVVVSHDREFLNRLCTHIVDLDYGTAKEYPGNYDAFLAAKEADGAMRAIEAERAEKRKDELQNFVDRFKAKASKARQAQSKAKQIERMEKAIVEPVYTTRRSPRLRFTSPTRPGKQVLEIKGLHKAFGPKKVLHDVSFDVFRGDKVAVIGPNGVGKSTLLKCLMGDLATDAGEITWGHQTEPQYFSQDHHENMPRDTTPYDWLYQWAPAETIGTIRSHLGALLFSGDDVHKSTAALSGGESARLVLAKLVLLKGNVLLLDEPTNHLDMESIETLTHALVSFEGTVLLVSHNRYVVERVATKVLEIQPEGVDLFPDDYRAYLEKKGTDHLSRQVDLRAEPALKKKKAPRANPKEERRRRGEQLRAFQAEASELIKRSKQLEETIETVETELEEINQIFANPAYFVETPGDEIQRKDERKRELEGRLELLYEEWEQVNLEVEELREKHGIKAN